MRNPSKKAGLAGANVLAMAIGGMLAGATVGCNSTGDHAEAHESAKHACKGMNACKGQGGCASGDNGCAGKNSCKGKGGCGTDDKHSCKGEGHSCSGKSSCKS